MQRSWCALQYRYIGHLHKSFLLFSKYSISRGFSTEANTKDNDSKQKKRVYIVSGATGTGKTLFVEHFAKQNKLPVVSGDLLQMYSNFKTSTNVAPCVLQTGSQPQFHLYHSVDFFEKRLTPVDYRRMVQQVIDQVPGDILIEGGSVFYLKYLFKDGSDNYGDTQWEAAKLKAIQIPNPISFDQSLNHKASEILATKPTWKEKEQYLRQVCPTYDGSVTKNDLYRLQKALSYAIVSEGKTFKRERAAYQDMLGNLPEDDHRHEFEAPFNELYDCRGVFFVRDKLEMNLRLRQRCLEMIEHGLLEEFVDFRNSLAEYKAANPKGIDYLTAPIGYKQLETLFSSIVYNRPDEFKLDGKNTKTFQAFFRDFLGANRQYATYQQDYCKKHLAEFKVVDLSGSSSPFWGSGFGFFRLVKDPILENIADWLKTPTPGFAAKLPKPIPGPADPGQKKLLERELHKHYDEHAQLTREEIRSVEKRLRQVFQLQTLHRMSERVF